MSHSVVYSLILISAVLSGVLAWPEFQLYTKQDIKSYEKISSSNITNSRFDYNKNVILLVHGFGDSGKITLLRLVKDALLEIEDVNVILVDWEKGAASPNYFQAASNTRVVAQKISEFLDSSNIDQSQVHCIGHSLGAHVCGFAGKIKQFKRISGLDPAGPEFWGKIDRLNATDAQFVDIIHTDGWYGIDYAIGHVDFFPNGGKFQAGCGLIDFNFPSISFPLPNLNFNFTLPWGKRSLSEQEIHPRFDPVQHFGCSHFRAVFFYAESIRSACRFTSVPCADHDDFKANKCSCSESIPCASMGYYANRGPQQGKFYLNTNKAEPFCQN